MDAAIALMPEPEEVVVAGDDLAGRAGEVDLEHRHVAAQVIDVEDQVLGKLGGIPEDDPADPQRGQPELVPRGADRLDPGQPEVEDDPGCAERGEETAAGSVHVNVDVQAGVGLQLVQGLGHLLDRLVRAGVGDAEGRHDHDRVLVDPLQHRGRIHHVPARVPSGPRGFRRPSSGRTCAIPPGPDRRRSSGCPSACPRPAAWPATATWPPCPPACRPPTSRWPKCRRCWPPRGAFHRSAIMCTHRRSISAVCGYSSRSIMFLLTDSAISARDLGFLPRLAERGQVLPRVAIQHQLIRHQLERVPGQRSLRREPVLGHRPGQIPVSEHAVLELVTDGLAVVQCHGQHLLGRGPDPDTVLKCRCRHHPLRGD